MEKDGEMVFYTFIESTLSKNQVNLWVRKKNWVMVLCGMSIGLTLIEVPWARLITQSTITQSILVARYFTFKINNWNVRVWTLYPYIYNLMSIPTELSSFLGSSFLSHNFRSEIIVFK
jgi:hypothetical protein